jgi:hypothetical protein
MYRKYLAIDQYGEKHFLESHPRKELMELHGVKHADKIYRDPGARHVGYVVAGHWYEVLKIQPLH